MTIASRLLASTIWHGPEACEKARGNNYIQLKKVMLIQMCMNLDESVLPASRDKFSYALVLDYDSTTLSIFGTVLQIVWTVLIIQYQTETGILKLLTLALQVLWSGTRKIMIKKNEIVQNWGRLLRS